MATKFPPEFLQEVEEQTVMSGMGEELDSAPTGDRPREPCATQVTTAFPQPGGFHDLLNVEFPETTDLDATAVRIWEFLEKGARQADAARQAFEQEINNFGQKGRTSTRIQNSSMLIGLTRGVLTGWWRKALPRG